VSEQSDAVAGYGALPLGERLTFIVLVLAGLIIAAGVSAVVGVVTYAGWIEPGSGLHDDCQTPP